MSSQWVPNFTNIGFEKVKWRDATSLGQIPTMQDVIPAELYEKILSEYEEAQRSMEEELCNSADRRCWREITTTISSSTTSQHSSGTLLTQRWDTRVTQKYQSWELWPGSFTGDVRPLTNYEYAFKTP